MMRDTELFFLPQPRNAFADNFRSSSRPVTGSSHKPDQVFRLVQVNAAPTASLHGWRRSN